MFDIAIGQLSRTALLVAALGFGGSLAGCADIHPEPNDPGVGMLDAPTDEAVQERAASERATEHGDQEEGKR